MIPIVTIEEHVILSAPGEGELHLRDTPPAVMGCEPGYGAGRVCLGIRDSRRCSYPIPQLEADGQGGPCAIYFIYEGVHPLDQPAPPLPGDHARGKGAGFRGRDPGRGPVELLVCAL